MASRRLYTAADVRRASQARQPIMLAPSDLITPLARDDARRLGVEIVEAPGQGATPQAGTAATLARGVVHVDGRSVAMEPFPFQGPAAGMDVRLRDVVTHEHGSPMAAGLMSLRHGSFPWTLTYDEIEYVIEGELHIGTSEGTVVGRPGDLIWIPKGTAITFGTPSWAKFLYVTYPAQWAEG